MQDAILTLDQIKANEALADLPEDKLQAFVTLANNAGKQAIDTYSGTMKRRWEEDVKTVFGVEKPSSTMPAHEFFKHAAGEKLKELESLKKAANGEREKELTAQIEELKKKVDNGSSAWKQEAEDYKSLVEQLKGKLGETEKTYQEQLQKAKQANLIARVQGQFKEALSGHEFDPLIPEDVRNEFLKMRQNSILNQYTPEEIEKNGETVIQWRDKNGDLVRLAEKGMEPATTADLFGKEIGSILKKSKEQTGTGSAGGSRKDTTSLDVRGAKTQVEAKKIIDEYLVKMGIQKGTQEFSDQSSKMWKENEAGKLPLR